MHCSRIVYYIGGHCRCLGSVYSCFPGLRQSGGRQESKCSGKTCPPVWLSQEWCTSWGGAVVVNVTGDWLVHCARFGERSQSCMGQVSQIHKPRFLGFVKRGIYSGNMLNNIVHTVIMSCVCWLLFSQTFPQSHLWRCRPLKTIIHCILKKVCHLMFVKLWKMWTDFQNSYTNWFVRKFCMYTSQRFPPVLQYIATLRCESCKSKNVTDFDSILNKLFFDMSLRTLWGLDLTFNSS